MANTREISTEEKWMACYFEELKEEGIVKDIIYQPEPFVLSNEVTYPFLKEFKRKENEIIRKTIINKHIYTPDFKIEWDINKGSKFTTSLTNIWSWEFKSKLPFFISGWQISFKKMYIDICYIEVKGVFDQNNMTRLFTSRTQPWVFQKYGEYINLIKVPKIFKDTFVPKKVLPELHYKRNTKKNKKGDKKYAWEYRTLDEFLKL